MSEQSQMKARAAVVAIAPVLLLIGFLILPYVSDQSDNAKVAEAVADNTGRVNWGVIVLTVAMALTFLAIFSIRLFLLAAGEKTWSFITVPLVVIGGTAIVLGTGLLAGTASAIESGGDGEAYLEAVQDWQVMTFLIGSVVFGLGWLSLALSVWRSQVLSQQLTWVVIVALVVLTVANFIPMGWATYVIAVAAIVFAWPLAYAMWEAAGAEPVMEARPSPA